MRCPGPKRSNKYLAPDVKKVPITFLSDLMAQIELSCHISHLSLMYSDGVVRRHFHLCQERLAITRIERGHFVDGLIIKVCSNQTSVAHLAMKMKHLLAGEHPNAMDVTTRYKSAPKVVKLFVKHNCVRHIRSRAGSKTCFYHGAHHYTQSLLCSQIKGDTHAPKKKLSHRLGTTYLGNSAVPDRFLNLF